MQIAQVARKAAPLPNCPWTTVCQDNLSNVRPAEEIGGLTK